MRFRLALVCVVALAGCPKKAAVRRPQPLSADAYAHYIAGRLAQLRGEMPAAIQELRAAAAAAPGEFMIEVALIDAIYASGDRKAARDEAVRAEEMWPKAPEVWMVAGRVMAGMGEHAEARGAFEQALRLDRTREEAWLGVAAEWAALEEPAKAEKAYRDLLRAVPDTVDGRFLLAGLLVERGAEKEAEPELRKVIELDPDHVDARLALAALLRRTSRLDEAVVETRQAFDRTGGDLEVAEELFWLLCEADDRPAAIDLLGLLDDPAQTLVARVGIASLYRQIGALDDAVRVVDAVRAEAADTPGAALLAAQARADRAKETDRDDAVTIALGLPTTADDKPAAIALAAEVLVAQGDADRALAVVDAALKDRPDAIDLLLARAQVLHARGDAAAGRSLLADAVKARPGSAALRYALASFEDEIGDSAAAAADAEAIIEARADHVPALNLAGFALAKIGKHLDRAERYLTHARALAPGDPSILDSWGWLLYQLGRLDEAAAALTHASHIAPNQTEILEHLAKVQAVIALQPR